MPMLEADADIVARQYDKGRTLFAVSQMKHGRINDTIL